MALVGTAPTIAYTPWDDPSWEIWAHASSANRCKRVDRYFDPHPRFCFEEQQKNGFRNYYDWLKACQIPVYMQERNADIPASVRIPRERILGEFRRYVKSTGAWMVGLAMLEGVDTLGLYGMHYEHQIERKEQRENFLYWLGLFEGRGGRLVIPPGAPLLSDTKLYGYDLKHEEYAQRKASHKAARDADTFNPARLKEIPDAFTPEDLSDEDIIARVREAQERAKHA